MREVHAHMCRLHITSWQVTLVNTRRIQPAASAALLLFMTLRQAPSLLSWATATRPGKLYTCNTRSMCCPPQALRARSDGRIHVWLRRHGGLLHVRADQVCAARARRLPEERGWTAILHAVPGCPGHDRSLHIIRRQASSLGRGGPSSVFAWLDMSGSAASMNPNFAKAHMQHLMHCRLPSTTVMRARAPSPRASSAAGVTALPGAQLAGTGVELSQHTCHACRSPTTKSWFSSRCDRLAGRAAGQGQCAQADTLKTL